MKITSREGTQGAPRTELNLEIIGAAYRDHTAQWNGNYNKKIQQKTVTCLQIERVQQGPKED